jgi:hypothetical protein
LRCISTTEKKCLLDLTPDAVHAAKADSMRRVMHEDRDRTVTGAGQRFLEPAEPIPAQLHGVKRAIHFAPDTQWIEADQPAAVEIDGPMRGAVLIDWRAGKNPHERVAPIVFAEEQGDRKHLPFPGSRATERRTRHPVTGQIASDDNVPRITVMALDVLLHWQTTCREQCR